MALPQVVVGSARQHRAVERYLELADPVGALVDQRQRWPPVAKPTGPGARPDARGGLAYVFPSLTAAGGILLLAHSHAAFQLKSSFLVQVTHSTMGAFAALMVTARWLELGLGAPWRRVAGIAAGASMLAIALVLVFYREANLVLPP